MIGAFRESLFVGNQHLYPTPTLKVFDSDGGNILNSTITGNTFSSWPYAGGAISRNYLNIIYCSGNIESLNFSGNIVRNVDAEVIEVTGQLLESSISSNVFVNVMLNAITTLTRVIKVAGNCAYFNFTANTIGRDEVTATVGDVLVLITGTAFFVDCSHNAFNTNLLVACNKGGFYNFGDTGNRVAYLGDVPTTGTWRRGDIVYDTDPSASAPPGWVCVLGGTPGTWKAMANLAA
jgi:hypothetical protein